MDNVLASTVSGLFIYELSQVYTSLIAYAVYPKVATFNKGTQAVV